MNDFKATPEQWAEAGAFASATRACILELRARVAKLEAQASSREVAEPAPVAGGLVTRVAYAITGGMDEPINWSPEARAAILEVARWLREQGLVFNADLLEQEAGQ